MTPNKNHRVYLVMGFMESLEIQDLIVTALRGLPSGRKDRLTETLERLTAAILRTEKKLPPSKRLVSKARKALLNPTTPKEKREWDQAANTILGEIRKEVERREAQAGN